MELPTESGVYVEPADDDLWDLGKDGMWRVIGRLLPFGGVDLQPVGPPVTAEQMEKNGVFPTRRVRVPDQPPPMD